VPLPRPAAIALSAGYHSAQVEVDVRLNTNEAPEGPPEEFLAELAEIVRNLHANRYPDRDAVALRVAIAAHHGVRPEQVFCANGSNEVLQCLFLAYGGPGRTAVVFEPTYALHAHIARLTGTEVECGARDGLFRVDPDHALSGLRTVAHERGADQPTITMLCSPNNPTGGAEPAATTSRLADAVPGLLVVDEAYGQFAPITALDLVETHPNLAVVRTFSKSRAMAALRLGYLIADPEVISACGQVALPYHLDTVKQAAGLLAFRYEDQMKARVARLTEERGRVAAGLAALGIEVWPSDANFLLFRLPATDASTTWRRLVARSVLVRDVSAYSTLEGCLRVTVGTRLENDRFLEALSDVATSGASTTTPRAGN